MVEQKVDDCLKHFWGQVQQMEGLSQNPKQWLSAAYFLVKSGLQYFQRDRQGQPCDDLIASRSRTLLVMHLAH